MKKRVDDDIDFITDEINAIMAKPSASSAFTLQQKQTIKKENRDMNKEQFIKTKSAHKAAITEIKAEIKQQQRDIKKHQLLIKQAKIMYKLEQMKEKIDGKK